MTAERVERRLAAVLAADVAGYSRLMGIDEVGTLAALKAIRREIVDPIIAAHNGRIVKTTGDGLLLEFASAVDAVNCGVAVQEKIAERAGSGAAQPIQFRIGINIGDIIIEGDDIFGDGVNVAARVENECEPGGVCLSGGAYEQVRGKTAFTFDDLGEHSLKNIDRPVRLYSARVASSPLSATVQSIAEAAKPLALPDKPSIAVLPFQNMSGDPEQEYFVDGLVEDIITALSRISWFFVIARNSSFTYKGTSVDVRQVGRELGVRYVLEGSVRKAGNRLRITGQLIDSATGNHIWADRYDGAFEDVFELQDKVTSSVVSTIEPKVQESEIKRAQAKVTENLTAYDLYMRAVALLYDFNEEANGKALVLLERAISLDNRYSSAHGAVCWCMIDRNQQRWGNLEETRARGLQAARLAIEFGKDDAAALGLAGLATGVLGGGTDVGLAQCERAVALNPNSTVALATAGTLHSVAGNYEQALKYCEASMRLNPIDPNGFRTYSMIGWTQLNKGQPQTALGWADKALGEQPAFRTALGLRMAALALLGRTDEAVAIATRLKAQVPTATIAFFGANPLFPKDERRELIEAVLRQAGVPD